MRLLVLNWRDWQHPWAGGAEVFLREVVTRLASRGHEVTVFCQRGSEQSAREVLAGVEIIRLGGWHSHTLLAPFWLGANVGRYDLVWEFTNKLPYAGPLWVRRPLVGVALHVNGKTAVTELGTGGWPFLIAESFLYRFYRETPFIAISDSTRAELVALGVNPSRISVVHCGVGSEYFHTDVGSKAERPTIICVSRLKRYKRIDLLLESMAYVVDRVPGTQLILAGVGDQEPRLRQLARDLGMQEQVVFSGFVDEAMKRALIDRAWIQVQPSMKEGWGLAVVEAAARGVPTIAFDVPGLRDSIVDGVTGRIVRSATAQDLGIEIAGLLADHARRAELSARAREWAQNFSWDATADRVEAVFLEATAPGLAKVRLQES